MLKKSLVIASFFVITSNAQTLDNLVNSLLEKNYTLKEISSSTDVLKEQISLSYKWNNPILSFGATDLQLNDITKRDKEPMQAHFVGITQNIPLGDKLEISKNIAVDDYEISKLQLEDKKLELKALVYEYAFKIKLIEERLALFEEFKINTKKLESLLKNLYKYNKASQEQIINTQIMYKELKLNSSKLTRALNSLKLKLEKLTYEKIETIDFDTSLEEKNISIDISSHPKILELNKLIEKSSKISSLEEEKKYSDIKMNLTYFQRDEKFEDYVNLSFAIPLSVYGSEDIKATKAKLKSVQLKHKLEDIKFNFKNKIETIKQNLDDSLITFNIIQKEILPKQEELQKILENYNTTLMYKKIDTRVLIKNQNEIIKYKLKAIDEKENYFTSLAKTYYFDKDL
ncbi:TolC family protein [Arcobacter arenosus]|uniref:TolC family protein n=1 Tax=Arcobacter arenosus TaxID=2576037 RepID=A0A5R8Y1N8_9BACT|nr:TolC family protein [Arcobacter arenosus]TLP39255.1 TolC family protein [Arcobacter arenosus]